MITPVQSRFTTYRPAYSNACLALFDENCSRYFATNERGDYVDFLQTKPKAYYVLGDALRASAAFGLSGKTAGRARINWIMLSPKLAGMGLGRAMIELALLRAREINASVIDISASQHSEAFFANFGAKSISQTENGWGEGMHRIDMELSLLN